jgi:hypothetical protein
LEVLKDVKFRYTLDNLRDNKSIGLVLAGNIPAVGFHDIISVFLAGFKSLIKLSSKDNVIIPALIDKLIEIDESAQPYFEIVERMKDFDAIIATGGNNTSRYFEYYFNNVPNLIRKSRSSVAVLTGNESNKDLMDLGKDIFTYFGLGCRNVSKLMIPAGYDLKVLLKALDGYDEIAYHNKYKNNYDYSLALYLLNREEVLANNCIILKEDKRISSRIACLHYEIYQDKDDLLIRLQNNKADIQCIIGDMTLEGFHSFKFGEAQNPSMLDYADGVDTIQFLRGIDE